MSGEASPEDLELGVAAGCDDVLVKPFDASELISMIQEKISAVSL
jgi:CheY-like chemotaxis protein